MSTISLRTLGPFRVECDAQPLTVDTRKALAMLVYLCVERRAHTRDALADLLWPEYDQIHARSTLRRTLSTLNAALPQAYLCSQRDTIAVNEHAALYLDVDAFHELLARCRAHHHGSSDVHVACLEPLSEAVELYQGDFLADFHVRGATGFEEWQLEKRDYLRRELAESLERLTRILIARHAFSDALPYARHWLQLDVLHEPAHRYMMRLLDWSGQRSAALQQYRECMRILDRELGVAPLEATTRLYEAIKEHRAPQAPPLRSGTAARAVMVPGMGGVTSRSVPDNRLESERPASSQNRPSPEPFVGREREWKIVLDVYESTESGGRILVLEGEAGIGKTRLITELAAHALHAGARPISAQCYEGEESLAFAPIAAALRTALTQQPDQSRLEHVADHWLSEGARLLPELALLRPGLPSAPPLESPGAQSRFFEGLRQILLAMCRSDSRSGLLAIDDLQWADSATLNLLAYLARRLSGDICMVLAWRSGDISMHQRLRQLLAEIRRDGRATHLTLGRLSPDAVGDWIASALGPTGISEMPEVVARLYEETEGLPFFIAEYVHAFASGALLPREQDWTVPGGVHDLLRSRLRAVSEAGWQVLTTAAILGRSFDFATVREASGRSEEETIAALEELIARRLISEVSGADGSGPRYDFTHEKLRALVSSECSLARRRLLHRRSAEVLAASARRQRSGGPPAGQIAQHYLAAGDETAAAEYYKLAGDLARGLYANAEALRHFQLALALGHPDTIALHEAIGDVHTLLGEYAAALASYEMAASSAPAASLARLERKLSNVYIRRGEWESARSHLEAALASLGEGRAAGERARLHADWSLIARHRGRVDEAQKHAEQALHLATEAGDERALAQVHNILGLLARDQGERALARQYLERSLELAERLDDPGVQVASLNNLALALGSAGDVARAVELAEAALALCATQGDRHYEAALHNNLADLLYACGRGEEAMAHLKQAVRIYAEIGVEAGAVQPAIWKLAEW